MQTETILLLPNPRLMQRLPTEPGCVIQASAELAHMDDDLWARLAPHMDAEGVMRFAGEAEAVAAGALVEKVLPYR